ncbi:hypothetical protein DUZ99_17985 [Xylanibacillus composti]|uniref:ABC-2 family transporter n=1 Tax=Xylanibacillus composti TaxID=1572762 RepID=A0A8J4H5J1_9BACL|nr:hypothetical protein [Xylanibacillus composti]MDT9726871.1 hypothetical protein [Xylanibacillus composti]GIQ71357.1 hypothetical protein XYCOK13_41810 [Xylanibacillus composti]
MNQFWKLIHYEFARLRALYLTLMAATVLVQFGGMIWYVRSTIDRIELRMQRGAISAMEYVNDYGPVSFFDYTQHSIWFTVPIALCIAALFIYVFLIWYRDWWGKNMFIYRLLMLPHSRMYLYGAKLAVILMSVLGLVAFQLLILPMQIQAFAWLMPEAFHLSVSTHSVILGNPLLHILIPGAFSDFVLSYAIGAAGVIIVFTAILLERSYRWKGIIAGIVYCTAAAIVFLLPILLSEMINDQYLYPMELFWLTVGTGLIVTATSIWLSFNLLKNKVSV